MPRKLIGLALLLPMLVGTLSCRPNIVLRMTTEVYHDGSLDRRVEIVGRTSDGEVPTEDDWLEEKARIRLAEPEAWKRVERAPGRLHAEGFFLSADELPIVLSLQTHSASKPARTETTLDVDQRVLLRRWTYIERHGDPFSPTESAAALEALVELTVEALSSELHDHFGGSVDPAPAENFLRNEARALAQSLLTVNRVTPGWENSTSRIERWTQVLTQSGVPALPVDDPDDFWDLQMPTILDWGRDRIATSLSTAEQPILPDDLSFWPRGDEYEETAAEITARVWGSEDVLFEKVEPHLAALAGFYGGDDAPRLRFESRVTLPGTLLTTNGTPDGDTIVWLFRERDMTLREMTLRARSVELQDEALRALGARRNLDTITLIRLADLLWERDRDGGLEDILTRAVQQANLGILRDEDAVPEPLLPVAQELADLLDPEIPLR
jgi:hypothetical protein